MTEEDVRRIVREEIEEIGGLDIGEVIALHVRTVLANSLKQIGAEEFMKTRRVNQPTGGH